MNIVYAVLVLGVVAVIFGIVLSVAAKVFEVEVDERLPKIQACLAGANCGGCGYPGCGGCAEAILAGKAPVNACAPAGAEGAARIAEIMGMEAPSGEKMVAHVICNGGEAAVKQFDYVGIQDCLAATKVAGAPLACAFGCLGYGSCTRVCKYGAISVKHGVAVVDEDLCVGCMACAQVCPRKVITAVEPDRNVVIACNSLAKGAVTNRACTIGCIGCGKCMKTCPKGAITITNNLAQIDYTKCDNCGQCASVCPKGLIKDSKVEELGEPKPVISTPAQ